MELALERSARMAIHVALTHRTTYRYDRTVSRTRFAPGALLHFGQGKWYPGERLPRWAFGCFWRKDGVPVWENVDLVAKEETDYRVSADDSALFIAALASRLGLDTK
jgi:uncharacterized protein (DUF2126 family)